MKKTPVYRKKVRMRDCKNQGCRNTRAPRRSECYSCYGKNRRQIKPKAPDGKIKMLMLDIETRPNKAYVWDIWNQNIGINQIIEPGGMLCFAAKWYGQEKISFYSEWDDGQMEMARQAWKLLDEADVLVHFYGSRFDVPWLNTEFLKQGFPPPSPFKQIDLKFAVGKQFKFTSNKLQFVSRVLGLEGKEEHEGFPLWDKVLNETGSYSKQVQKDARGRMRSYNERDVFLLDEVYEALLPWIPNHPNKRLYEPGACCPTCGAQGSNMVREGFYYTKLSKFLQYRCLSCKSFFRGTKRMAGVDLQEAVLTSH